MKQRITLFIIFGMVLFLALTKVWVSNFLSTKGVQVVQLEQKLDSLDEENLFLEEKIAQLSSLSRISLEAKEQGFVKPDSILGLTSEMPVALR